MRTRGKIERGPKESLGVRFLYRTLPGRVLLKGLTRPIVSRLAGCVLDSRWSAGLIPFFIRKYRISVRDVECPEGGFRSFNQFFCRREVRGIGTPGGGRAQALIARRMAARAQEGTEASKERVLEEELRKGTEASADREREEELREGAVLSADGEKEEEARELPVRQGEVLWGEGALISPCDGYLSVLPIRENRVFDIKHTCFTLEELLQEKDLAQEFREGLALIFRLTPSHYHRYCFAADGDIVFEKKLPGVLHCVRPVAAERIPVYAQNAREYQVIDTRALGKIVQMEVGALMIGRITNPPREKRGVRAGEEKGYFEFGGSTIVLLLKNVKKI